MIKVKKFLSQNHFTKDLSFPNHNEGISLVELSISIFLASLFFSFYSSFVEIASRYTSKNNPNSTNSNGLIIDHHKLYMSLDNYIEFLSQPGISLNDINNITQTTYSDLEAGCSYSPNLDWNIPVNSNPIPNDNWQASNAGYAICLKSTSLIESSLDDLISKSEGNNLTAHPGIYLLIALPKDLSVNSLPVRKLFCRPAPYC